MNPHNKKAFARAKPAKIVIEELYQYKADVRRTLTLSFEEDKSQGEIKIEFVYDGKPLSPGWKMAVLLQGLRGKWKLPARIRKHINDWRKNRFIGPVVRGMDWLFGWVWRIIWRLPGYLLEQYLPDLRPDASKSFDASALADVEKCSPGFGEARVGYLALCGYSKPAFDEDWPEHRPLLLEIPVDELESKISKSQRYVIKRPYSLQKPLKEPVRLGSVLLYDDISHDKHNDLDIRLMYDARVSKAGIGEMLRLEIPLIVDIEPPDLDERNQLKRDMARDLWKEGKRWKESQKKKATAQEKKEEEDLPLSDQLGFFPEEEWDSLAVKEALSRLSSWRGGYLFFTIDSKNDEGALEKLQEKVLDVALKCSPPVPIMKPYAVGKQSEQQLAIVPVPRSITQQIEGRFTYGGAITESRASMRNRKEFSWWELALEPGKLIQALEAAANTDGGYIIVEIGPIDRRDKILEISQSMQDEILEQARNCVPPMRPSISHPRLVNGRAVLIVRPPKLPYVFTHRDNKEGKNKAAWIKGGEIEDMKPNDVYELFKDRGELHHPTLVDPPVVTYARIEWAHMDYRKRQGIRHDPDNRALEWVDEETMQQTSHDVFERTLAVQIMHPIELYQMGHVKGQIRVRFNRLWSGLDVVYFDATGQRRAHGNGHKPEIVKSTSVVINLDIALNDIFKRRPFYSYRCLEFEGVKPEPDRLADIISLLADLGLEDINVRADLPFDLSLDLSDPATFEEVVSRWGILITGHIYKRNQQVKLKMAGSPQIISRQRKNGKRLDRMWVPTGQLRITLAGKTRGESPPLELSRLLNQIQHLLKERFSFVRMHLK